ncbi:MAG: lysophospholipase L1-like esterase [Candidatus Poriferisodalaceae bacterium]|jgi:lysophospholipase L1-like esterase
MRSSTATFEGLPKGATYYKGPFGHISWTPTSSAIGRHEIVELLGVGGQQRTTRIIVEVRAPAHPTMMLALGDSVASGHGLDRSDFLGLGSCWRASDLAYGRRVFRELDPSRISEFALVACSGSTVTGLATNQVSGGPRHIGQSMTQVEWALQTNPGLITITIGANDLRFDKPQEFFEDGRFQADVAAARVDAMERQLGEVLTTLVEGTDATILVTTLHNPTSPNPHGVSGCRGSCFLDVTNSVVDDIADAVRAASGAIRTSTAGSTPPIVCTRTGKAPMRMLRW